jgi:RimJ/RimL family protein N-acetyltransferase
MAGMDAELWPLAGLRVRTPRLELRVPSEGDLSELARLAALGVHDPKVQPFGFPWTDVPAEQRGRNVLQFHWGQWASWKPEKWSLDLVAVRDGTVVGTQGMGAHDFAVLREVRTGSWLGLAYQGQGFGTEMRAAVLHLAFAGLGARCATSGAFTDNWASLGVSRKLGYVDDGVELHVRRGRPAEVRRLRIDRASWEASHSVPVTVEGLEACRPMFGLPTAEDAAAPPVEFPFRPSR